MKNVKLAMFVSCMVITLANSSNNNFIAYEIGVPQSISDIVDIYSDFMLKC